MPTDLADLVDFLLRRLAEDERAAQQQMVPIPGDHDLAVPPQDWPRAPGRGADVRALRDVEAKRRIVEMYAEAVAEETGLHEAPEEEETLETVVRLLSLTYEDHPDYDRSWRP
ncbi:DUF6221 family protein [Marinactinospora thermotolerans]|uniref:Uncharacterized protein n=1 Tax=Marinactinospora thermotolerans DSM 45154 TaxID=1122192 RepID=A0A1T4K223_9ACTN|nr:DUF6221 family protein [Marinactinospora thermotolerans]SJZ36327.1 hypothetical protein SAMN02745673_00113 [Marinactinospora thermotolerans DSM 45154]